MERIYRGAFGALKLSVASLVVLLLAAPGNGAQARQSGAMPRPSEQNYLIGEEQYVNTSYEDTLADIAERHSVGYRELRLANPHIDPWLPGEDTRVLLPRRFLLPHAPRQGIVLNIAEMRLYYYPAEAPGTVLTFPVSVGRRDWQTPLGPTRLVGKRADPPWYPPESIRKEAEQDGNPLPGKVPAGPDNPLGQYALDLALPGYLIHGTNRPYGIGMPVTHGCIRLHPNDIELLYEQVPNNTPVNLINQPFKVGWQNDVLYLEVHPSLVDSADAPGRLSDMVEAVIRETTTVSRYWVNWEHARRLAKNPDGLPHPIGKAIRTTGQMSLR